MEEKQAPSIASIATKYGLIQGVIGFVAFLVEARTGMTQNRLGSLVSIVIAIVLMVLAHLEIRRTHKGMMTYPQGLGSGTLLATVGAVISSILVFIYVSYIDAGYIVGLRHAQQIALQQRGVTGAQAQQAMAISNMIMTPAGIVVFSLIGGIILGFIVALIVSIFTQKSDPRAVI